MIMELAHLYRALQVSVFGSLVRGELDADSDIDFLDDWRADEHRVFLLQHPMQSRMPRVSSLEYARLSFSYG